MVTGGTIAAIATGQAVGGIGVVRISGDRAIEIADRVFECASGAKLAESAGYRAHFGRVFDSEGWSDEAIALVFRAPHSYTGEDVVEISCHGGLTVTRLALAACLSAGASPAAAGEFSRRAFENGRISLTQAEAVMAVISSEGRQAALAAQSALNGRLAKRIAEIREPLITLAGGLAAWCDYPDDEDIPAVTTDELIEKLTPIESSLSAITRDGERELMISNGINTVICGKPNVGKSTLMNLLAGCEKSIVTDIPGTTRDVVEEHITLGGCVLKLADTAGIHNTDNQIETIGIDRAMARLDTSALVIAVFDGSAQLDSDDIALIEKVREKPCVAVINKNDRPLIIDSAYIQSRIQQTVFISAANNDGIEQLEEAIKSAVEINSLDPSSGLIVTQRQLDCAKRAHTAVKEALAASRAKVTFDAIDVLICDSIDALLEMEGKNAVGAVVDEVFSHFCVGK